MDHDPPCCARVDPAEASATDPLTATPGGSAPVSPEDVGLALGHAEQIEDLARIDWIEAQTELDRCDGYVVLAVDPQTGEVDAHGPFPGLDAVEIADDMRITLDREGLDDVVVRVVRWHQDRTGDTAA
ncbi:hypothetical protein EV188_10478 [Actinomycetospora succinea]|uniref:Uncharacterized protein n=1 Tax=Actinomycetospora succinea TaxID=663603 RepID=A0A4R6VIN2_9PSEU|nr:hypothetical protein [Actinomycetospora succinea]TDQ58339.1 hypothetical protein EV188_10478 [Actinomycetospora succinea]